LDSLVDIAMKVSFHHKNVKITEFINIDLIINTVIPCDSLIEN